MPFEKMSFEKMPFEKMPYDFFYAILREKNNAPTF